MTAAFDAEKLSATPQEAASPNSPQQHVQETAVPKKNAPDDSVPKMKEVADHIHNQDKHLDDAFPDRVPAEHPSPIHPFPIILSESKIKSSGVVVLATSIILVLAVLFGVLFVL